MALKYQCSDETCHSLDKELACVELVYSIYLCLTLLSMHCIGYITMGSLKGRGNQYKLVGQDSAM